MAAFLTPDQIRKVRIKGSTVMKFAELDDKELRIVKMSSSAQLETQQIQKQVRDGNLSNKDFLIFMVKNSCANMEGDLFSEDDALGVFDLLPLDAVTRIVNEAAQLIGNSVKVKMTNGEATIEATVLTETEKK